MSIIIGGGHNGLVTAAYLARAGRKVLVLERRELVGGCAVTEEIWPGYRVSTGAYLTSLLQERIVRELELERSATRWTPRIPPSSPSFPTAATSSCGRTARRRWRRSPNSPSTTPRSIPRTKTSSSASRRWWKALLLTTPPKFPPRAMRLRRLPAARRAARAAWPRRTSSALVKIFTQSAADFLDEWFESRGSQGHARHRWRDRRQWRTALARHGLHPAAPLHGRRRRDIAGCGVSCAAAWARCRKPSRRRRASQGRRDPHERRRGEDSGAQRARARRGARRRRGDRSARTVASNLDPKLTFLRLLDERDLDPDFVAVDPPVPHRRHQLQDQPGAQRPARVHRLSRRARPAPPRHDAHLPQHRVRRARLGRRQVRPALASARCSN